MVKPVGNFSSNLIMDVYDEKDDQDMNVTAPLSNM